MGGGEFEFTKLSQKKGSDKFSHKKEGVCSTEGEGMLLKREYHLLSL